VNAIEVEGLGKEYWLTRAKRRENTFRDALSSGLQAVRRSAWKAIRGGVGPGESTEQFWALRDLDLTIPTGQAIGIIGPNGAGKSTFLKILARITEPTRGVARVRGRVGSLLEVGTGFHSELTGRENIFLSGAILGMSKRDIIRRFDEIVDFSGVESFLDTPVKHFSSGMYLRLAFSVAAHLEPDVLVVDEVLAVGDVEFQQKCLGRMDTVVSEGRTVLLVSHQLEAVRALCSRCVLLVGGRLHADGVPADVTRAYLSQRRASAGPGGWIELAGVQRRGTGEVLFERVRYQAMGTDAATPPEPDAPISFDLVLKSDVPRDVGSLAVVVSTLSGEKLINTDTIFSGEVLQLHEGENLITVQVDALHLLPGMYRVSLWVADPIRSQAGGAQFDYCPYAFELEVFPGRDAKSRGIEPNSLVTHRSRTVVRANGSADGTR